MNTDYTIEQLKALKVPVLRDIAKNKKLAGYSYVIKDQLIRMIINNKSWRKLIES